MVASLRSFKESSHANKSSAGMRRLCWSLRPLARNPLYHGSTSLVSSFFYWPQFLVRVVLSGKKWNQLELALRGFLCGVLGILRICLELFWMEAPYVPVQNGRASLKVLPCNNLIKILLQIIHRGRSLMCLFFPIIWNASTLFWWSPSHYPFYILTHARAHQIQLVNWSSTQWPKIKRIINFENTAHNGSNTATNRCTCNNAHVVLVSESSALCGIALWHHPVISGRC